MGDKEFDYRKLTMVNPFLRARQRQVADPKQAAIITVEEVSKFFDEAPKSMLLQKVALALGLSGFIGSRNYGSFLLIIFPLPLLGMLMFGQRLM